MGFFLYASFNPFFTAALRMAVERFSINGDEVKNMVCTKLQDKRGGDEVGRKKGEKIPETTVAGPKPIRGMLYAGHRFQIEEQACEDDGRVVCASFRSTVSEAKTEITCLMTKAIDGVTSDY